MGCNLQTQKKKEDLSDTIIFSFLFIGIAPVDKFWNEARQISVKAELLRQATFEQQEILENLSQIYKLSVSNIKEACLVWLWTLSAQNQGKVESVQLEIYQSHPFISWNQQNNEQVQSFGMALYYLINAYSLDLAQINAINVRMQQLIKTGNDLQKTIKQQYEFPSSVQPEQPLEGQIIIENQEYNQKLRLHFQNLEKLNQNAKLTSVIHKRLSDPIQRENLKEVLQFIHDIIKDIDRIGKKAYLDENLTMKEIFNVYYIGNRKNKHKIKIEKEKRLIKKKKIESYRYKLNHRFFPNLNINANGEAKEEEEQEYEQQKEKEEPRQIIRKFEDYELQEIEEEKRITSIDDQKQL